MLFAVVVVAFGACQCKNKNTNVAETAAAATAADEPKNVFADFTMPDLDRNDVSTKSVIAQNNITIVDFWASWCGPCRAEIPSLVALNEKYGGKGLGILGISLDKDHSAWKQAIDDNKMTWTHLSELRGWDNTAVKALGISGIPHTLVVDRESNILATGLRGAELTAFIDQFMQAKK